MQPVHRTILVVDDDPNVLDLITAALGPEGAVLAADSAKKCLHHLQVDRPDVLILDLGLPNVTDLELLHRVRREHATVPVVIFSASGDLKVAVDCMHAGAVDFIQKPFDELRLVTAVRNAETHRSLGARVRDLSEKLKTSRGFEAIKGSSLALRRCIEHLRMVAQSDVTVLLQGESGTGKEIAAHAIHQESERSAAPFVAINCGAISETLIESELFGHEKGAFTGASATRKGCFETAEGGTIFLDEVGELSAELQVRLLRVLQEREVVRVGSSKPIGVDVRIIAASLRDLKDRTVFREDLFYRLSVFPIVLPPLREREDDVLHLGEYFLQIMAKRHSKDAMQFRPQALELLLSHSWPGNVRELENVVERATILCSGAEIDVSHLPMELRRGDNMGQVAEDESCTEEETRVCPLSVCEKLHILRALKVTDWNIQQTAVKLEVSRTTLYRKIAKYGLASLE